MKISEIVKILAKGEDGKSKVKVGDIREVIGLLSDLLYADQKGLDHPYETYDALVLNGKRRAKKKALKPVEPRSMYERFI